MGDWRMMGQGARRRMGAPSSHLEAANWGSEGRGHPDEEALEHISSRSPDAGSVQPTKAAYKEHEKWAIARYGPEVWKSYKRGGWGRQSEV